MIGKHASNEYIIAAYYHNKNALRLCYRNNLSQDNSFILQSLHPQIFLDT